MCSGSFWGWRKSESWNIFTKNPLTAKPDDKQIKRIRDSAKKVWGTDFDGVDIWSKLRYTLQGKEIGCKYWKDSKFD